RSRSDWSTDPAHHDGGPIRSTANWPRAVAVAVARTRLKVRARAKSVPLLGREHPMQDSFGPAPADLGGILGSSVGSRTPFCRFIPWFAEVFRLRSHPPDRKAPAVVPDDPEGGPAAMARGVPREI